MVVDWMNKGRKFILIPIITKISRLMQNWLNNNLKSQNPYPKTKTTKNHTSNNQNNQNKNRNNHYPQQKTISNNPNHNHNNTTNTWSTYNN